MLSFPFLSFKYSKTTIIGIIILFVCLSPSSEIPHFSFPFSDKIIHFLMFFTFSSALSWDITYHKKNPKWIRIFLVALLITVTYGIITELLQYLLIALNRTADVKDLFFDFLGSVFGIIIVFIIRKKSVSEL